MPLTLKEAPDRLESLRQQLDSGTIQNIQLEDRAAMSALLERRSVRLEQMRTKSDQKAAFGEERWNREVVKLQDINTLPGTNMEGKELQSFHWSKTPKLWRSFQEAFSDPLDTVVPRIEFARGRAYYPYPPDRLNLQPCIADPDRVPDKLLIMTGFLNESSNDGEFERLYEKYSALSSVKMAIESAWMLDPKYARVMILQKASDEAWAHHPDARDISDEAVGMVLITREHEKKDQKNSRHDGRLFLPRTLAVNPYESVYAARRSAVHVARQYQEDEAEILASLQNDIAVLNTDLDQNWRPKIGDNERERLLAAALKVSSDVEELLHDCRQQYKRRIYTMLVEFHASLERRHVGGAMAKLVGANNAIEARSHDRTEKLRHVAGSGDVLNNLIKASEDGLRKHRISVATNIGTVGTDLDAYKDTLRHDQLDRHVRSVMRPLRLSEKLKRPPQVRPHITYINAQLRQEDILERNLLSGDRDAAKLTSVRMHVIGKLQAANICIEKLKEILSDPRQRSMTKIRSYVVALDTIYRERAVFPDVEPIHFAAIYEPLEQDIARLHEIVKEAEPNMEEDPEVFGKYCDDLMLFLDTMDVEAVMRELERKLTETI